MKCPIDQSTLQITAREGIEIDYCPQCRGIWLDRGELDKIIERTAGQDRTGYAQYGRESDDDDHEHHDHKYPKHGEYDDPRHDRGYSDQKKRKKGSFIGDLFDF